MAHMAAQPVSGLPFTTTQFADDGEASGTERAASWLMQYAAVMAPLHADRPTSVVFDIDDTLIQQNGMVILPMQRAFVLLKKMGVQVHVVTARPDRGQNRALTVAQMKANGLGDYDSIELAPPSERTARGITAFKERCRQQIARTTRLLATVGDSAWDLTAQPTALQAFQRLQPEGTYLCVPPGSAAVALKLQSRPRHRGPLRPQMSTLG